MFRLPLDKKHVDELRAIEDECDTLRRESRLLHAERDALMTFSGGAVLFLDSSGVILKANARAAKWLGVPSASLQGRTLLEATLSHELLEVFGRAREFTRQKQELRMQTRTGEMTLVVCIERIASGTDDAEAYILVADDVTQLRHLETVRRDFVANVSHELRTPLTSIRAIAETLQNGALQDDQVADRFLNMIIAESERLTRISTDLLVLSAAESRVPEKEEMDLSSLANRIVNRFQRQAEQARIRLSAEVTPAIRVFANRDQIEQVLINLIDNAIKYTPAEGSVVTSVEEDDSVATVRVADTGIGILQEDLPRIFERFYRVDKARSRESGGTGLGLSIVKHIVEAHGGAVAVESEYRRGSTFRVTLPTAPI